MSHELLLEWMTERGSGSITRFSEAHRWLSHRLSIAESPYSVLGDFTSLGYIELDWRHARWAVAPTCVMLLPGGAGLALLAGGRTARLTRELSDRVGGLAKVVRVPVSQAPSSLFLEAPREADLRAASEHLGVPFAFGVPETLARVLPSLDVLMQDAAVSVPPVQHFGVRRWPDRFLQPNDGRRQSPWLWEDTDDDRAPGLYRYDIQGPRVYHLVLRDGSRHVADYAVGVWGRARDAGNVEGLLWWDESGIFYRPGDMPLPALQARALTLCTGLPQHTNETGTHWVYGNVPRTLAETVARSLGQQLSISGEEYDAAA